MQQWVQQRATLSAISNSAELYSESVSHSELIDKDIDMDTDVDTDMRCVQLSA